MALKQENVFIGNILTTSQSCAKLFGCFFREFPRSHFPHPVPRASSFQVLQLREALEVRLNRKVLLRVPAFLGFRREICLKTSNSYFLFLSSILKFDTIINLSLCSKWIQTWLQFFVKTVFNIYNSICCTVMDRRIWKSYLAFRTEKSLCFSSLKSKRNCLKELWSESTRAVKVKLESKLADKHQWQLTVQASFLLIWWLLTQGKLLREFSVLHPGRDSFFAGKSKTSYIERKLEFERSKHKTGDG